MPGSAGKPGIRGRRERPARGGAWTDGRRRSGLKAEDGPEGSRRQRVAGGPRTCTAHDRGLAEKPGVESDAKWIGSSRPQRGGAAANR